MLFWESKMTKELKRSIFAFLDTELLSNLVAEKKYNEINNSGTQQLSASATKKNEQQRYFQKTPCSITTS